MANNVDSLRSALELLKSMPGQLIETDVEVDPSAELSGVYRYIGAGGTVARPTQEGPAMIFNNVKGHPGSRVAIGLMASRSRVGALLDCNPQDLGKKLYHSVDNPVEPIVIDGPAPCQEVVYKADDPDFDLNKLVPAIEIGSCFEAPTTPMGYDELAVAGALRNKPVELVQCLTVNQRAVANAEYVIEGEVIPGVRVTEDQNSHTGYAMPEFPGYTGPASDQCWMIKVKAVTTRKNPIMQTCIGPSEEHVSMAGIPTEASIYGMIEKAMPGRLQNVYCATPGGGKFMAVLQFKKLSASDEGRQRQAALLAFSAFAELKHIFIVDEDVDCFDMKDVIWAMNTRFQGDADIVTIPGVRCHPLDPSNDPTCSPSIRDHGIACKTIFDCTVPYDQKYRFHRARFLEVDPTHWVPDYKA